jgi:hypothetical protein
MDCEKFDAHVIDELYEELDEVTRAALRRHMDGCARCSAALHGLRDARGIAVLPIEEPSDDLEERILARAAAAQRTVPWHKRALRGIAWAGSHAMRPQLAMAAVLVLILGSSLLLLRAKPGAQGLMPVRVSERGTPSTDGEVLAAAPAAASPPVVAAEAKAAEEARRDGKDEGKDEGAAGALAAARATLAASGCAAAREPLESVRSRFAGSPEAAAAAWEAAECHRKSGDARAARELYAGLRGDEVFGTRAGEMLAQLDGASHVAGSPGGAAAAAARAAAKPAAAVAAGDALEAEAASPPAGQAAAPAKSKAGTLGSPGQKAAPAPVKQEAAY